MASFSGLAAEVLEYIVTYLPQRDIHAICQLDKYFHALAVPLMYCSVDLSISPDGRLPRIDRFCQNIVNDSKKAKRVHTIRMGKSPRQAVEDGETSLPRDESFDDQLIFQKAKAILNDPILEKATQGLQESVENRQYAAYAALILLLIPCLHRLEVAGAPSLTCDLFFDHEKWEKRPITNTCRERWYFDLSFWNRSLQNEEYLEILVFPFPLDVSELFTTLSLEELEHEAAHMKRARMDVLYMFETSLTFLGQIEHLESLSVWQPAHKGLQWSDEQMEEFASACRDKDVTGRIMLPMLLRTGKTGDWDLCKEITVFDRKNPEDGTKTRLLRGEWEGRPVGLASQYHLHALKTHQVMIE
ncbi:hypothetical protein PTRG_04028 [Pyrenophora tritici-repentis Pt-1C-BFP]|uniref:F-box domain-containing protein n=1 Tax=Pyrenophora tritici-repentis (strain Pt-1C-BFP) TaxID=426418 RepID=B2W0P3_PYRTR|nr:uncharacterized protein PTRG_04028 [Pyrenophora tritici-repentis Pt-1C-BFP]EDU46866.1 hypothetical protein PTRG_04028 [Pyrenophora tritici-repentis Pt-1C-BFP]